MTLIEELASQESPRILYAYRAPSAHFWAALRGKYIWNCDPLTFNDPFDCDLPIQTTGAKEDMIARTESFLARRQFSVETQKQARASAAQGRFYKGEHLIDAARKTMRQCGIACFSKVPNDILMWSHYASKHQGFCLGFDVKMSPWMAEAKAVHYTNELPLLSVTQDLTDLVVALIFTKSLHWAYEKEWRFLYGAVRFNSANDGSRALAYRPEALRRVIFGCRIEPSDRDELIRLLAHWPTKVHTYQAERHPRKFGLTFRRLS